MPEVISFSDALARTNDGERTLLIGNGFSADYFRYSNLLASSGLDAGNPPRTVFDALDTVDFEVVVRALEAASIVERAYGNDAHAADLDGHAMQVREALVRAIWLNHPENIGALAGSYAAARFIGAFDFVYTVNYDLLLYWVDIRSNRGNDGFGLGRRVGRFFGPFSEDGRCDRYNLHGGLHLFKTSSGGVEKAVNAGQGGALGTIANEIVQGRRMPIYVAEGTSGKKMAKINSVAYLRHCYDMLLTNRPPIFVYGHSADENDAHIYRAIFESPSSHLYFGVYRASSETLRTFDGRLAKYQHEARIQKNYTFFDSESAQVWRA